MQRWFGVVNEGSQGAGCRNVKGYADDEEDEAAILESDQFKLVAIGFLHAVCLVVQGMFEL